MKKLKYFIAISTAFLTACGSMPKDTSSSAYYDSQERRHEKQKVGKPYQIKGNWYKPKYSETYQETGIASWYGDYFHGKKTANGEVFNMNKISAAHKTLPLPSYVVVTNLDNGKKLYVRVNDRGPFADNRIIDLSKAAAYKLGFKNKGLARVRVTQVSPPKNVVLVSPSGKKTIGNGYKNNQTKEVEIAQSFNKTGKDSGNNTLPLYNNNMFQNKINKPKQDSITTAINIAPQDNIISGIIKEYKSSHKYGLAGVNSNITTLQTPYKIKVGVFGNPDNINRLKQTLVPYGNVSISPYYKGERQYSAVSIGPYASLDQAKQMAKSLEKIGIKDVGITK